MDKFIIKVVKEGRNKKYDLYFQYNQQFIETVKSVDEDMRKYDPSKKCWTISPKGLYLLILKFKGLDSVFFDFGGDENRSKFLTEIKKIKEKDEQEILLKEQHEQNKKDWVEFKEYIETNYSEFSDIVHKNLKPNIKLFPHQIKGVMFCQRVKNVLLAHDMGAGKSLVGISFSELCEFNKVVVITPNSLKFNYFNEICKFTNSKAYVYNSKNNKYKPEECKYIIFNYEMLNPSNVKNVESKLKQLGIKDIDCVILDECQKIKNGSSNTASNFKKLFTKSLFKNGNVSKIFMSGTPAPNRAYELYNVLHEISPLDFKNKNSFYSDYCGMKYDPSVFGGWNYDINATNYELLFQKMKPFVDRRRKCDILDLPEKLYQKILIELSNSEQKQYDEIKTGIIKELLQTRTINHLTVLIRLRQYLAKLKIENTKEIIDSIVESGDKIVVIDMYKESLNELKKFYGDIAGLHTGDVSVEERNYIVQDFQNLNGKYKIFLGSVETCNYGLTLTEANKMLILTPPDSLGKFDQVCDRIHRIGQNRSVLIMCPVFSSTIDEKIYDTLDEKRYEISAVMDNEKAQTLYNMSVLSEVLKDLMN